MTRPVQAGCGLDAPHAHPTPFAVRPRWPNRLGQGEKSAPLQIRAVYVMRCCGSGKWLWQRRGSVCLAPPLPTSLARRVASREAIRQSHPPAALLLFFVFRPREQTAFSCFSRSRAMPPRPCAAWTWRRAPSARTTTSRLRLILWTANGEPGVMCWRRPNGRAMVYARTTGPIHLPNALNPRPSGLFLGMSSQEILRMLCFRA